MFSRPERLRRSTDVQTVYRRGRQVPTPLFRSYWLPRRATGRRITVVVSTKVSKQAVTRNLIKRRLRSLSLELIPATSGYDVVISALPASRTANFDDLQQALTKVTQTVFKSSR